MAIDINQMDFGASASGIADVMKQIKTEVLDNAIETVDAFQSRLQGPIGEAWSGPDAERWMANGVVLASNISATIREKQNQIGQTLNNIYTDWEEFQNRNVQSF